jgi:hypothetical protein
MDPHAFQYTIKPVNNNPKFVAIVDRWSLFIGRSMLLKLKLGLLDCGRSLFGGGH